MGYTEAGTWITYNDVESLKEVVQWEIEQGLAGTFIYSADMDTKDYTLMNTIADTMGKTPAPSPPPGPHPSPGPPGPGPSPPAPSGECKAISPTVTDQWCDTNCHAVVPFCPPADCKCTRKNK